jgi:cob(I)alamin adenosyltransferase
MIIVFTGDGKGKTTAALGQMVRAAGRGKNVLMIQFIKGPWRSGEDEFAERFTLHAPRFTIMKMGLGFVGILGDKLPKEAHIKAAEEALEHFRQELAKNEWYLIVLDEVNVALSLGLLKLDAVLAAVKSVPENRLVVLTGRGAPQELIDTADLVTEMREVKHPYAKGEKAKYAVEF